MSCFIKWKARFLIVFIQIILRKFISLFNFEIFVHYYYTLYWNSWSLSWNKITFNFNFDYTDKFNIKFNDLLFFQYKIQFDIIGYVFSIGEEISSASSTRKQVTLMDKNSTSIVFTLWGYDVSDNIFINIFKSGEDS